jgi:hypothetical protein
MLQYMLDMLHVVLRVLSYAMFLIWPSNLNSDILLCGTRQPYHRLILLLAFSYAYLTLH